MIGDGIQFNFASVRVHMLLERFEMIRLR